VAGRGVTIRDVYAHQDRVVVRGPVHVLWLVQVRGEVVVPGVLVQHRLDRVDVPHVRAGDVLARGFVGEHVVQGADGAVIDVGGFPIVEVLIPGVLDRVDRVFFGVDVEVAEQENVFDGGACGDLVGECGQCLGLVDAFGVETAGRVRVAVSTVGLEVVRHREEGVVGAGGGELLSQRLARNVEGVFSGGAGQHHRFIGELDRDRVVDVG